MSTVTRRGRHNVSRRIQRSQPRQPPLCTWSPGARHPGIGGGEREGTQPYGVEWTKPEAGSKSHRHNPHAVGSAGELITRDSPYFPLRTPPSHCRRTAENGRKLVAAHGPRMLRITGRYADAWVPFVISRPDDYASALEAVRTAASDAARDPMTIVPALNRALVTGAAATMSTKRWILW